MLVKGANERHSDSGQTKVTETQGSRDSPEKSREEGLLVLSSI